MKLGHAPAPPARPILRSKLFWVGVLYFSEGLPLGLFYDLFPVYFRTQGVNLAEIGLMSLLSAAWSLKFIWAPAIDRFRHHRRWMFTVDIAMAVIMGLFALYGEWGPWVWVAIGLFTVLSATNDIAIDGYTIELLERGELGLANGFRIGFYRAGMIGAGIILMVSDWLGWAGAFTLGAALLASLGFVCLRGPREQPPARRPADSARDELVAAMRRPGVILPGLSLFAGLTAGALGAPLIAGGLLVMALTVAVWQRRTTPKQDDAAAGPLFGAFAALSARPYMAAAVLFILTFKLADTSIGFMVKPFWVDAGFSASEIGLVSVNIGLALSIAGGLAGGWFTDRAGIFHGLWVLGLTQIISNLGYVWAAIVIPLQGPGAEILFEHRVLLYGASAVESFTQGLGTGAFLAFLMAITSKRNAATEYAVLSSIFALSRAFAGWAGGIGAETLGYGDFFLLTFVLGLPAYILLPWIKRLLDTTASDELPAVEDTG